MFPIPIQRSMVFLRKTELLLLKALVKDVEYRGAVKPENIYLELSNYRYVGEHYSDAPQAAKVLEQLGLVKLKKNNNSWYVAINPKIAREAVRELKAVSYGFKPMERRIVTLISLAMRYERPIELSDAREIIGSNGPSMRFIMAKSDMMKNALVDGRHTYQYTTKGLKIAQAWLDFSRLMISHHGGAMPRQFVVQETSSLPSLLSV
jgi:predicted transcriptional regulator